MSKERRCDKCKVLIKNRESYVKLSKIFWEERPSKFDKSKNYATMKQLGVGDICLNCFKLLKS